MNKNALNFESHFFNDSLLLIETPMIRELKTKLHQWLWNGCCGALITGLHRVGKSEMIKYLSTQLKNRLGESIPAFSVSLSLRDVKTVTSVFRNLCYSMELEISKRASSDEMCTIVSNHIGEAALKNSTKQTVLFVDEMQFLSVLQLNAFAELFNRLKRKNVNLTIFFVGNTIESEPLIDAICNGDNELIRARFFLHKASFGGVSKKAELIQCLEAYDKYCPDDFKYTCTEYFLPKEYKNGWRLVSIADPLWRAYRNHCKKFGSQSWPMQYFSITIRLLLADFLPNYPEKDNRALYNMCRSAIHTSNWR